MYRTDYHTHTLYSDGHGWPEDYIPFALKAGLAELGFSDHLTLTDEQQDWSILPNLLDEYCRRILDLNKHHKTLDIRLGLEVDFLPGKEEDIKHILNSYPFDYVLGSVHYLDKEAMDSGPEYYENKDLYELYRRYFEVVGMAAETGLFDIMAHPDLVRMYGFFPDQKPDKEYKRLATRLARCGVAIELNTNGKNRPLNNFYPDPEYLHLFYNEGVPLCVNSDSHFPSGIAQFFDQAYSMISKVGYKQMATFDKRKRTMKNIGD